MTHSRKSTTASQAASVAVEDSVPVIAIVVRVFVACALFYGCLAALMSWSPSPADAAGWAYRVERLGVGLALSLAILASVAVLLRRSLGMRWSDMGLGSGQEARFWFLTGFMLWLIPATLAVLVTLTMGLVELRLTVDVATLAAVISLHLLTVLLLEAFPEELLFRGYIATVLSKRLGPMVVIVVQAALFTAVAVLLHRGVAILDASLFLTMGLVFGWFRWLTGSIWAGMGFHLAFQTGMQLLIGGQRGPMQFEPAGMMAMVVLGMIPFAVAIPVLEHLARRRRVTQLRS